MKTGSQIELIQRLSEFVLKWHQSQMYRWFQAILYVFRLSHQLWSSYQEIKNSHLSYSNLKLKPIKHTKRRNDTQEKPQVQLRQYSYARLPYNCADQLSSCGRRMVIGDIVILHGQWSHHKQDRSSICLLFIRINYIHLS